MTNLCEEICDYIGSCGYGLENVKIVRARGINDGILYGVEPSKFFRAIDDVWYDEQDESRVHVSKDIGILMDDGSMFYADLDRESRFEWFNWKSESEVSWQDCSALIMAEPDEVCILLD